MSKRLAEEPPTADAAQRRGGEERISQQMTLRVMRKLCAERGLTVRGTKMEVFKRLNTFAKAPCQQKDRAPALRECESENGESDPDVAEDPVVRDGHKSLRPSRPLTAARLRQLQKHVRVDARPRKRPELYSPSNSVVDDDDSDSYNISLDSGSSGVMQLRSDRSEVLRSSTSERRHCGRRRQ